MSDIQRVLVPASIIVEDFGGNGEIDDHVKARLYLDGVASHSVTFSLSHLDFMRTVSDTREEIDDIWDRSIEEMAQRLAAELTYAGLVRFDNPINVQSHLSSFSASHRSGLRVPGTVLVTFEI